jgi:hypothetical protein
MSLAACLDDPGQRAMMILRIARLMILRIAFDGLKDGRHQQR